MKIKKGYLLTKQHMKINVLRDRKRKTKKKSLPTPDISVLDKSRGQNAMACGLAHFF